MVEGMTGFAQVQGLVKDTKVAVELRSYNHRYLDIVVNTPNGFKNFEDKIRALVKQNFARGRLTLNIYVNNISQGKAIVNEALVKDYLYKIRRTSKKLDIQDDLSMRDLINLPGVFAVNKIDSLEYGYWPYLEKILHKIIKQLKNNRLAEGRGTFKDLAIRIKILSAQTEKIKNAATAVLVNKKRYLNPEEFSLYRKATDISEELMRLKSHLKNFKALFTDPKIDVKGKELDFIAQEMQREANTIAAKSQAYIISECVVRIKAEIEKIREQAQNIQ